jgi:CRISPR-associated protein Cas2
MAGPGRALMVFQVRGEQRLSFLAHDHHWVPVDVDGVVLMRRPTQTLLNNPALPSGWSKAAKRRRFGRRGGQARSAGDKNSEEKWGL